MNARDRVLDNSVVVVRQYLSARDATCASCPFMQLGTCHRSRWTNLIRRLANLSVCRHHPFRQRWLVGVA